MNSNRMKPISNGREGCVFETEYVMKENLDSLPFILVYKCWTCTT